MDAAHSSDGLGYNLRTERFRIMDLRYLEPYWGKFVEDQRVPRGEIRLGSWDGPILLKNIAVPDDDSSEGDGGSRQE